MPAAVANRGSCEEPLGQVALPPARHDERAHAGERKAEADVQHGPVQVASEQKPRCDRREHQT